MMGDGFLALAAEMIKRHERLVLKAYDDATELPIVPGRTVRGHVTVGYGRALDRKGLSPAEADFLLANDLNDSHAYGRAFLGDAAWDRLNDARKAALMDMAHNLGQGGLGKFALFREAVVEGNWQRAHDEVLASRYAKQVKGRAIEIAMIWLTGEPPGAALVA